MAVYLDHNATTPALPAARAAMNAALEAGGNPSSVHAGGRAARRIVEDARAAVAELVCAFPAEVIFTSGGTEANALALRGVLAANGMKSILVGMTEHDSVMANAVAAPGVFRTLGVDANGVIDLDALDRALANVPAPVFVSVMLANNETGVIAPVAGIAQRVKAVGGLLHVDAAQAAGRVEVNLRDLGADLMTVSAHKMGGIQGAGALVVRDGIRVSAQIAGGGQELGRRSGTENVAAIAAFGAAAASPADWSKTAMLRDRLEAKIAEAVPQVVVYGAGVARLPNTSMFGLAGVAGETQMMAMDLAGFAISSGAACSSGKMKVSHVLAAMGAAHPADAIRVSLGPETTGAEIDGFVAAWTAFADKALKRRTAEAA
ncbi:MAG: cysteine desulfurase family protein [Micropepsaceae bacterium]